MTPQASPRPALDAVGELLTTWLPARRWFADKNTDLTIDMVASVRLPQPEQSEAAAADQSAVVSCLAQVGRSLYQIPLVIRRRPVTDLEAHLIGVIELDLGLGMSRHWVYDGPYDPLYVQSMLQLIGRDLPATSEVTRMLITGHRRPGGVQPPIGAEAQVMSGEQSNTSIIVGADSDKPLIIKVFRVVANGPNPDVVVQSALADVGCTRIPAPWGWISSTWPQPDLPGGRAKGHLAFASEFLAGSQDAWRVATRAVARGESFADRARDLGAVTAEVHAMLATALPTTSATPEMLADLASALDERINQAVEQVPELSALADQARAVVADLPKLVGPWQLQQVHGDYHLGQVLNAPGRGWVLLDFEGEPMRPLTERLNPDLALRDVAGMLRSFDYAARYSTVRAPEDDPSIAAADAWADEARTAFLAGYAESGGTATEAADYQRMLQVLELDKALYEVVYDSRNRPAWVSIPLAAVRRLLAQSGT